MDIRKALAGSPGGLSAASPGAEAKDFVEAVLPAQPHTPKYHNYTTGPTYYTRQHMPDTTHPTPSNQATRPTFVQTSYALLATRETERERERQRQRQRPRRRRRQRQRQRQRQIDRQRDGDTKSKICRFVYIYRKRERERERGKPN